MFLHGIGIVKQPLQQRRQNTERNKRGGYFTGRGALEKNRSIHKACWDSRAFKCTSVSMFWVQANVIPSVKDSDVCDA